MPPSSASSESSANRPWSSSPWRFLPRVRCVLLAYLAVGNSENWWNSICRCSISVEGSLCFAWWPSRPGQEIHGDTMLHCSHLFSWIRPTRLVSWNLKITILKFWKSDIVFWPFFSDAVAFQEMLGGPTSYYQRRSTQHTLCIEMGMIVFE